MRQAAVRIVGERADEQKRRPFRFVVFEEILERLPVGSVRIGEVDVQGDGERPRPGTRARRVAIWARGVTSGEPQLFQVASSMSMKTKAGDLGIWRWSVQGGGSSDWPCRPLPCEPSAAGGESRESRSRSGCRTRPRAPVGKSSDSAPYTTPAPLPACLLSQSSNAPQPNHPMTSALPALRVR